MRNFELKQLLALLILIAEVLIKKFLILCNKNRYQCLRRSIVCKKKKMLRLKRGHLVTPTSSQPSPTLPGATSCSKLSSFTGFMWDLRHIFSIKSIFYSSQFAFQTVGWYLSSAVWNSLRPGVNSLDPDIPGSITDGLINTDFSATNLALGAGQVQCDPSHGLVLIIIISSAVGFLFPGLGRNSPSLLWLQHSTGQVRRG